MEESKEILNENIKDNEDTAAKSEKVNTESVNEIAKLKKTVSILSIVSIIFIILTAYFGFQSSNGMNKDLVETNDKIAVDMLVTENGKKNDNRSFTDVLVSVNKDSFSEDILNTLKGMKIGETKSVTVKETLLKDGVDVNEIPESAYQDGSAASYYEEKDVKYTFKVKTIWKYASDIEKTEDKKEESKNK